MFARFLGGATVFAAFALASPLDQPYHPLKSNSFGIAGTNATYDYVVVGGGNAGNTIAARLAQTPGVSVAVVEAGAFYEIDNGNASVIPGLSFSPSISADPEIYNPLVDWGFVTTPQAGAGGRNLHYARGKTLGGSTALNIMVAHRATVGTMQKWADEVDDQSYTWDNVLPYYKKSVNITAPDTNKRLSNGTVQYNQDAFSADGGPLHVGWSNYVPPFSTWASSAFQDAGIRENPDGFDSGSLMGSAYSAATVNNNGPYRESSQTSFLELAMATTDIKVYTQALAKRVLFDAENKATGVLVQSGGRSGSKQYLLTARKEVILSAGAFQSPQLLMVSGIGPREQLEQHGIPVVKDLPGVGSNLWDQAFFAITNRVDVTTSSALLNDPAYAAQALRDYYDNKGGPFSQAAGPLAWETLGNISSTDDASSFAFPSDWPDVEYILTDGPATVADPADGHDYASIAAALLTPTSRGSVFITSPDTADPPVIDTAILATAADERAAIVAFRRVREIWSRVPVAGPEFYPGADVSSDSDAQVLAAVREQVLQIWHASGTCAMGRADSKEAVVDSRARVYGVQGLRVVDASAFPFLPPGHPQMTVYMLAEKIADDIIRGL